jgi:UDP-N-acetylmuramate dehydrogenase
VSDPGSAEVLLRDHTTLHLGGAAGHFYAVDSESDLVTAVQRADEAGVPVLVLGGGSNLVVADEGFPGVVVAVATRGIAADLADCDPTSYGATCGGVSVTVAAGERWDDFVAHCVGHGWVGVEALSGIPGTVGATPIQNVGAYGQQVGDTVAFVRTWDRVDRCQRTFPAGDCGFGYRSSRFKSDPGRYLILEVGFQFKQGTLSAPLTYAELRDRLDVDHLGRAPMTAVRERVLALRAGKGMVIDPSDHDTWSAGSFFTNPIVASQRVPEGAPSWPQPDGSVKTSAAWLIEHAGFAKGFGNDLVSLSTKHTLALTNRGGARTEDLLALARQVRDGVEGRFGITLEPEPQFVGCSL